MQTIAVGNHKGGVGKTTTAYNLGYELAKRRRVLLIDLDYQASLTAMYGIEDAHGHNVAQVLGPQRAAARSVIRELSPTLSAIPAHVELADVEASMVNRIGREVQLRRALATVDRDFDVCLVDCPPSLGVMTINALAAATFVLAVTGPTAVDLHALEKFLSTVEEVRREINPDVRLGGILITQFDPRYGHHQDVMAAMTGGGLPVLLVTIPRSVRVAEASTAHQPLGEYAPGHSSAAAYQQLSQEIERWLNSAHK